MRTRFFATCANQKSARLYGADSATDLKKTRCGITAAFQDLLPGQLAEELMEIVIVLENE